MARKFHGHRSDQSRLPGRPALSRLSDLSHIWDQDLCPPPNPWVGSSCSSTLWPKASEVRRPLHPLPGEVNVFESEDVGSSFSLTQLVSHSCWFQSPGKFFPSEPPWFLGSWTASSLPTSNLRSYTFLNVYINLMPSRPFRNTSRVNPGRLTTVLLIVPHCCC